MKSIKAHWRPLGVFWDLSPVLTDVPSHYNQLTPTTQAKEPNRRIMLESRMLLLHITSFTSGPPLIIIIRGDFFATWNL